MSRVIMNTEQIQEACQRIGKELCDIFKKEEKIPVIVGVMKGSLNFMFDLMKFITVPIYTDYVQFASYQGTKNTGKTRLLKDLSFNCENRTVVIIEDIVDTGYTLQYLKSLVERHNPKRIILVSLLNKQHARKVQIDLDFAGLEYTGDDFLIGYGLDFFELERNVPFVYAIEDDEIEKLNQFLDRDMEG